MAVILMVCDNPHSHIYHSVTILVRNWPFAYLNLLFAGRRSGIARILPNALQIMPKTSKQVAGHPPQCRCYQKLLVARASP